MALATLGGAMRGPAHVDGGGLISQDIAGKPTGPTAWCFLQAGLALPGVVARAGREGMLGEVAWRSCRGRGIRAFRAEDAEGVEVAKVAEGAGVAKGAGVAEGAGNAEGA